MDLESLKFEHLVQDLIVDNAAWRRDSEKPLPKKKYVIVFTARSGSSWLTSILSATKKLGYPEEYLNPSFIRNVAAAVNTVDPAEFLKALQRRRQSPNGIFGIEVREIDVRLMGQEIFFSEFNNETIYFNLWRSNIVAQAISLYRAVETKHFHSSDSSASETTPPYDNDAIKKWIVHLVAQENANYRMLCREKKSFYNLRYEDMIADKKRTLEIFEEILKEDLQFEALSFSSEKELKKVSDQWNTDTEMAFRHENSTYLAKIEASREILAHVLRSMYGKIINL